jgi:hypothetical protein
MSDLALIIAAGFGILFVILAMMIVNQLSKRDFKINIPLIGFLIIKYIHQYRKITLQETGKTGPLFYPCLASINLAFILLVVSFLLY